MNVLIRKTIKYIKNNQTVSLVILGTIIIITAFIYFLLSGDNDKPQETLIDVPLQIDRSVELSMENELYEVLGLSKRPKAQIFNVVDIDLKSQIEVFLAQIGKTTLSGDTYNEILTIWDNDSDIVQYSSQEGRMSFKFADPVKIPDTEFGFVNQENAADVMAQVARSVSNEVFEYTNIKVKEEGNRFRIEANREIEGYRIENPGLEEYSDRLVVDAGGRIIEGSLLLISLSDVSTVVNIIHPSNIASLVKEKPFPKEINQGYPVNIKEEDYNIDEDIYGNPFGDVIDAVLGFPQVGAITASEIELVYFYNNSEYPEVIPVYRIDGFGEVTYNGKEYSVPIGIYANAIDPDLVYIPSDLDEPTPDL